MTLFNYPMKTTLQAAETAAHNAGELARAREMAQMTGRSMSNWLPESGPYVPVTATCHVEHLGCGWSGMTTPEMFDDETMSHHCPRCGEDLLV